jgi:hypothetical protein
VELDPHLVMKSNYSVLTRSLSMTRQQSRISGNFRCLKVAVGNLPKIPFRRNWLQRWANHRWVDRFHLASCGDPRCMLRRGKIRNESAG